MRDKIKGLYPGCKLKPVTVGGCVEWYPYITFIERLDEENATVILSNGESIHDFNPNGWMEFVLVDECLDLENK